MPGRLSSPVCLTVIWFLSWSLHASRAQIQTDEGEASTQTFTHLKTLPLQTKLDGYIFMKIYV